jgi:predicted ATPase/DNA-binding CsgD family transcriptional regulator
MVDQPSFVASGFDPLIGRDVELEMALDELGRSRLVTLTGAGGSGKTRLADACLTELRGRGQEGWFVDLSSIEDRSLIGAAITTTMRLEGGGAQEPLEVSIQAIADRDAVLVLDNVEQIIGVSEPVARLLLGAPHLRVLATSRAPIGLRGEVEVAVPTLELPTDETVTAIENSPAGALFLARARSLGRLRSIDASIAADIWTLLHGLGGLPLAIELAAARMRAMSPAELLERLAELGPDAIDSQGSDRHRSLRAILAWTLRSLSPDEVEVLEATSVCAGFDLDLVRVLAPGIEIGDAIESLVALGLVVPAGAVEGRSRFKLLETIRLAVLRGLSAERLETLQERHARRFVDLASDWYERSAGGWVPELIDRLDADADNIRRALDHLAQVSPGRALVLAANLDAFWRTRGRLAEGLSRLERLEASAPEPSIALANAAATHLALAAGVSSPPAIRDLADRVVSLARAVGSRSAVIEGLLWRTYHGAYWARADAIEEHVAAELGAIDLDGLDPRSRINLGHIRVFLSAMHGFDSDEYMASVKAQQEEARRSGWVAQQALIACNLAQSHLMRRDYGEAAALAGEAAELMRDLQRPSDVGWALGYKAAALALLGRSDDAVDAIIESARIAETMQQARNTMSMNVSETLRTAIPVAAVAGMPLLAARLWGAMVGMSERGEYEPPEADVHVAREWLAKARSATSPVAIELAIREGREGIPLDALRALRTEIAAPAATLPRSPRLRHGEFTPREIEVLTLVGQGKADPEIADILFISAKTASVHVTNIKEKLGVRSRLEVALRARELGLVDGP